MIRWHGDNVESVRWHADFYKERVAYAISNSKQYTLVVIYHKFMHSIGSA